MAVTQTVNFQPGWVAGRLDEIGEAAQDLSPLMDNVGALLEQSARDRIESSNTAPDGTPWLPSDRVEQFGGKTLLESGRLAGSLTHQPYADRVEIGSGLIYAGVHQSGAIITAKDGGALTFMLPDGQLVEVASVEIPARPYLGVSDDDEIEIRVLVANYFGDLLESAP